MRGDSTDAEAALRRRTWAAAIAVAAGLALVGAAIWALRPRSVPIEVSQQTTYITTPTRADGWVDYLEAVDWMRRASLDAGGTNAAPALLRAYGPGLLPRGVDRAALLARLGVHDLPTSTTLKPLRTVTAGEGTPGPELPAETTDWLWHRCHTKGHKPPSLGQIREWLADSQAAFSNLREASRAASLYVPIARERGLGRDFARIDPRALADIEDAFRCRAGVELLQGDVAASWDDIDALWKLGQMAARSAEPGEYVIAGGMWDAAMWGTVEIAMHPGVGADRLATMRAAVEAVSFAPATESAMIRRLQALDAYGTPRIVAQRPGHESGTPMAANAGVARVLMMLNEQFDALDAALQFKDPRRRRARVEQVWLAATFHGEDESQAELRGAVVEAGRPMLGTEIGAMSSQRLTSIALALVAWRRQKGAFPASLAELGATPKDPGSGEPFIYKPGERQFTLYGIGDDGRDEGGAPGNDVAVTAELPPSLPTP